MYTACFRFLLKQFAIFFNFYCALLCGDLSTTIPTNYIEALSCNVTKCEMWFKNIFTRPVQLTSDDYVIYVDMHVYWTIQYSLPSPYYQHAAMQISFNFLKIVCLSCPNRLRNMEILAFNEILNSD